MAQTPVEDTNKSADLSPSMATASQSADSAKQPQKARKSYNKLKGKPHMFPNQLERPGFLTPERSQRFIFRDAGPMHASPDAWVPNFHPEHEPYFGQGYQPGFRPADVPTDFRSPAYPRKELFANDDLSGWRGSIRGYGTEDLDYLSQSLDRQYEESFMEPVVHRRHMGSMHARRYSDHPFHGVDDGYPEIHGSYDSHRRTDRYLEGVYGREPRARPRMSIEQLSHCLERQSLEERVHHHQLYPIDNHGFVNEQDFSGNFKNPSRYGQDYHQISPRSVHEFDAVGDRSPSPCQGSLENGVWIPFELRNRQQLRVMQTRSMAAAISGVGDDVLPSQDEMDMHLSTVQYVR